MSKKKKKNITASTSKETTYVDNASVFKYINPNDNDILSDMSGMDLQDLIILIDDYYIQLREQLGFDQYITFGLELEFEDAMKDRIDRKLQREFPNGQWRTKYDGSLFDGAEISTPILKDTKKTWENVNKVCSIVEPFASIGTKSGGHIHIGTQVLGGNRESWLNFIKLWSVYENIAFRFAYGDFLTARPSMEQYSVPMSQIFWKDYEKLKKDKSSLSEIVNRLSRRRYQSVNFTNVSDYDSIETGNTIEFRCPNGTLDPAIWQNNVNLFVNMLTYSRNSSFNDDLVKKRHQINADRFDTLKWYNEIYLEQALELCDMLFTNNFDKVYFLRQYLKSFQVCKNWNEYPKAQTLTKKGIKKN